MSEDGDAARGYRPRSPDLSSFFAAQPPPAPQQTQRYQPQRQNSQSQPYNPPIPASPQAYTPTVGQSGGLYQYPTPSTLPYSATPPQPPHQQQLQHHHHQHVPTQPISFATPSHFNNNFTPQGQPYNHPSQQDLQAQAPRQAPPTHPHPYAFDAQGHPAQNIPYDPFAGQSRPPPYVPYTTASPVAAAPDPARPISPSDMPRKAKAAAAVEPSPVRTKFPTARIKRIMQADEEVGKVAQQTPIAVGKALELFMISIVSKSADVARERGSKRVTTQMLKHVVETDEQFDFLREIVSKVDASEEKKGGSSAASAGKVKSESDSDEDMADTKKKPRGGRKRKI